MNDIVYGKNSFFEALNNNRIIKAYVIDDSLIKNSGVNYQIVDRTALNKMAKGANHQGYFAEVKQFKLSSIDDITRKDNGLIVMLDGLEDVHNLGAIIRTCDCAGVDGIIYKTHNSVKINDTVAKVASGALEYSKIVEVTNLVNTIKELKTKGYWIVGSDGSAKQLYTDIKYDFNVVLIVGSEGKGISRLVKEECDYIVKLPMFGHITSLNASVAAGILIYNIVNSKKSI